MESLIRHMQTKIEQLLGVSVDAMEPVLPVTNNMVYRIQSGNHVYMWKQYKQRNWPEDGKLPFVNQTLRKHHMPCANIIAFDRNDPVFPNGYLLEEWLPGKTVAQLHLHPAEGTAFYESLAKLLSRLHRIPVQNFGYIGSGVADYDSFCDCLNDIYDSIVKRLASKQVTIPHDLQHIKTSILHNLRCCRSLPSVLCHGDLSAKNVIVDAQGELTLIDWDDAMAYPWIADLSRLTYAMKVQYNEEDYARYRHALLSHYETEHPVNDFDRLENSCHVWIGLDHLDFYAGSSQFERALASLNETIAKL